MVLRTIATGSSGNCHALISNSGEIILLDVGIPEKAIKKGIDWNISKVAAAFSTHVHSDHSLSASRLLDMGIPVFAPYVNRKPLSIGCEKWKIKAFDLTDLEGNWTHTNGDGSPCPCYGFLIEHPEMGTLAYITDTEFCKWRFKGLNHILIGVNHDNKLSSNDAKALHVMRGHMSIDTACEFVNANYSDGLQNVIMCHLSKENSNSVHFLERMKKVARNANVDIARPMKEWVLAKGEMTY